MTETKSTKDSILEAASRVTLRDGAAKLTLEAVAKEAGVSKGGLLYHYPNKEALIEGLVALYIEPFEAGVAAQAEAGAGGWTRAFVRASFDDKGFEENGAGLLAAAFLHPTLLEPVKTTLKTWQARGEEDGLPTGRATLLRLATDGLWLWEALGISPLDEAQRETLRAAMLELAQEP